MRSRLYFTRSVSRSRRATCALVLLCLVPLLAGITTSAASARLSQWRSPTGQTTDAEAELQTGISLTREGRFAEAIPHLLAAKGRAVEDYAANFNLALCYVATNQSARAIEVLESLKAGGHATPAVDNLLAQAYVGTGRDRQALDALREAVAQTPEDEKLYLFVADACMDHQAYDLGLQILSTGLQHLPSSARLHYERGVFYSLEDLPDSAAQDYQLAEKLAPDSEIFYMAAGQAALLRGNISEAVRVTGEGIQAGYKNHILLALFGSAVADSGAEPDQPTFTEARAALEKSIAEHPNFEGSRLALAKLDLLANRLDDAIANLERARQLAPADPSVYSHLAVAYRRKGNLEKAQEVLAILARLDVTQVAKYKTDSPNKAGYVATGRPPRKPQHDQ